jgi:membrane-bound ClpP family serine protease
MTSGGNGKQRFSFWAAITFFIVAILCAIESKTGGDHIFAGVALVAFVFGLISVAGVWANGLLKSEDPDNAEWMNVIK